MSIYKPPWVGKWAESKQQKLQTSEIFQARGVVRTPYVPRDVMIVPKTGGLVISWRTDPSNPENLVTRIYRDDEKTLVQELPAGVNQVEIPGSGTLNIFISFATPGGGSESRKIYQQGTVA